MIVVASPRDSRHVIVGLLRSAGYDVRAAPSTQEALVLTEATHAAVTLIDAKEVVAAGSRAIRHRLAQLPWTKPVVVGAASETLLADLGAAGHIEFPFAQAEILREMRRVIAEADL